MNRISRPTAIMSEKFFPTPSPFQLAPNTLNTMSTMTSKSSNTDTRSKSLDPPHAYTRYSPSASAPASVSSRRRSPTRRISFQIREKKHDEITESPPLNTHLQICKQEEQIQQQSAFDPWGSTSFSFTSASSPHQGNAAADIADTADPKFTLDFSSPTTVIPGVLETTSSNSDEDATTTCSLDWESNTRSSQNHYHHHHHHSKKSSRTTHHKKINNNNYGKHVTRFVSPNFQRNHHNERSSATRITPTQNNISVTSSVNNTTQNRKPSSLFSSSSSSSSSPSSSYNKIIPGVSQMTMRQTLAIIFSAFWERADLYTDVLALDHDKPSARQLRLAFFRQGRTVLATPIESPDDMTTIDSGMKPVFAIGGGSFTTQNNSSHSTTYHNSHLHSNHQQPNRTIVQSGVKVSRKAKIKFQAINLAYDLLNDPNKRKAYNEWRLWHCRLPDPSEVSLQPEQQHHQQQNLHQNDNYATTLYEYQQLSNQKEMHNSHTQNSFDFTALTGTDESSRSSAMGSISIHSKNSLPSILRKPSFGKKMNKRKNNTRWSRSSSSAKIIESSSSSVDGSERRIRWNEEVEELVILDCSRDQSCRSSASLDQPKQEQCPNDFQKENIHPSGRSGNNTYTPDPNQNHTIENNWFGQNTNGKVTARHFNSMSLQDSRLTLAEADPSSISSLSGNKCNNNLDDSLIDILGAPIVHVNPTVDDATPNPFPQVQQQQEQPQRTTSQNTWAAKIGNEMKQRHLARQRKSSNPPVVPEEEGDKPGHHVVADDTFHIKGGNKNNVKINVRSYQKEKNSGSNYLPQPSSQEAPVSTTTTTTKVQEANNTSSAKNGYCLELDKKAQYEIDVDDYSIDTRSTKNTQDSYDWRSQNQSTEYSSVQQNDCALFGQSNRCLFGSGRSSSNRSICTNPDTDCGSVDLAKGFQATLSNFINAAVSDMKEGLVMLTETWEENVPKKNKEGGGENTFMFNSFELGAMMDMLKAEMSNIPRRAKGDCTG